MLLRGGFATGALEGLGDSAFDDVPDSEQIDAGDLEGDPAIAFRRTLGMFATGVTVLDDPRRGTGARDDRERVHVGLPAAAARAHLPRSPGEDVRDAPRRQPLRGQRARPGADRDVRPLRRPRGPTGPSRAFAVVRDTPLVDGALAHLVARVVRSYWGGDHSLFLGHVEYARYGEGEPLLFHGGRYERLVGDPQLPPPPTGAARPRCSHGATRCDSPPVTCSCRSGEPPTRCCSYRRLRPSSAPAGGEARGGELIGEIGRSTGGPRIATITAVNETDVLSVSREELFAALEAHPDAAIALIGILAGRFRETALGAATGFGLPPGLRRHPTICLLPHAARSIRREPVRRLIDTQQRVAGVRPAIRMKRSTSCPHQSSTSSFARTTPMRPARSSPISSAGATARGALPGYTFVNTGVDGAIPGGVGPVQDGDPMTVFFVGARTSRRRSTGRGARRPCRAAGDERSGRHVRTPRRPARTDRRRRFRGVMSRRERGRTSRRAPRGTLTRQSIAGSSASHGVRYPLSSHSTGKNDSSRERSPWRR